MYVRPNFESKAALKRAIANGETVTVFSPGLGSPTANGVESIEGPHFPKPHKWYGTAHIQNGKVVRVV